MAAKKTTETASELEQEQEALRLHAQAETKFKTNHLKSALKYANRAHRLAPHLPSISGTLTSLTILRSAAVESSSSTATPNRYKILGLEPFSNATAVRKQYKKLALLLHPDKNPSFVGSDEAFKLVGEASEFLSDKVRKQVYDMKLRMRIQEEKENERKGEEESENTFWTACSTCRLLHQFERRYVGHNLMCPGCNKSFKAFEVVNGNGSNLNEEEDVDGGETLGEFVLRRKMGGAGKLKSKGSKGKAGSEKDEVLKGNVGGDEVGNGDLVMEGGFAEWGGGRLRTSGSRKRMSTVTEVLERSNPKRSRTSEETMTLAEFQSTVKRKLQQVKVKSKIKEKEVEKEEGKEKRSKQGETFEGSKNNKGLEVGKVRSLKKSVKLATKEKHEASKGKRLTLEKHRDSSEGSLENMVVVDSDFYDFDKDRAERSFKKGQVWAVYDDDDGMPRAYCLIDELISANPFDVRISWLDSQNSGDEKIVSYEKTGFHIPCGRFKVALKTSINSINIFSHVVDCDRAAREVYQIYPKKGSVWALFGEAAVDADNRMLAVDGKRCYDIVVFLTTYSEVNGLSMAYLEKVDGYKTVFKRQEMGSHAIRFLGKDDLWLISHQIPARRFPCDDETTELLKDCWELDPASLPSDLLTNGGIDN